MRISFVIDAFNAGGKERRCLQIIQGLNNAGYKDVQLIIINNGIAYHEIYDTSATIVIIDRKRRGISEYKAIKELREHLKSFKPDIVQAWSKISALFVSLIKLSCRPNFKYLISYVADCNAPVRKTARYYLNKFNICVAKKIIGNSEAGLKAYSVPLNKRVCIYNGFNQERKEKVKSINLEEKKKELGIISPYVVSMIARVDNNKDYESFIKFAHKILKKHKDVIFLAVGTGNKLEYFKRLIPKENQESIKFLGYRDDVEELIMISTVTVLLTNYRNHKEGISNAILESMALGVPVIATLDGGTPEIIENGFNGYTVSNNNIDQCINCLEKILSDNTLRSCLSENCQSTVYHKFNLENTTSQYIKLYLSILK